MARPGCYDREVKEDGHSGGNVANRAVLAVEAI